MRATTPALICLLLFGAIAPGAGAIAAGDATAPEAAASSAPVNAAVSDTDARSLGRETTAESNIVRHLTLHRTPDEPGTIRATFTYEIPDSVTKLKVSPDDRATLLSADGFTQKNGNITWDGETSTPTLVFRLAINETHTGARAIGDGSRALGRDQVARETGYAFVDTGSWAIVRVPRYRTAWRWVGTESVGLVRETSIDGPGATGGQIAYLGEHTAYEASGNGQRFRLIVPQAASMAESPDMILAALVNASGMLDVGARDQEVFFVAAPATVNWGPAGLEYGGSDAWVLANHSLSRAANPWFHEYVHTRQAYRSTTSTRWTVEAIAEYYAATLTLRQGHIGFRDYRRLLERGTNDRYADDVLADPTTWSRGTPYYKGALVFGNVDRRIRLATNSSATAEGLFQRMNQDDRRLTAEEFYSLVERVSTAEVREYAIRYTQTQQVPEMWSRETHREVFADVPRFEYNVTYRVTGPYRNRSYNATPRLVLGETLHVNVTVRNVGSATGRYSVGFSWNETTNRRTGRLDPDTKTTVTFERQFDNTGKYAVVQGNRKYVGKISEPAEPRVTQVSVEDRVAPGEPARLVVTVGNPELYPARGTVVVTADDTEIARWTVFLASGVIETRETTVTFEQPGQHSIRVGDQSVTLEVTTAAATGTPSETPATGTEVSIPGFTFVTVVLALLGGALVARGREGGNRR